MAERCAVLTILGYVERFHDAVSLQKENRRMTKHFRMFIDGITFNTKSVVCCIISS
jgi:hypothetical protein